MKIKTVNLPGKWQNPQLVAFLQSRPGLLLSNWLCQGMRYMNPYERLYRLATEALAALLLAWLLSARLSPFPACCSALAMAHTGYWLFNGHFFVLWRYLSERRLDPGRFLAYVEDLQARLRTPDFLRAVVAFGSLSRDAFHGSSDFDVRLVWRKGFLNALRAFNFCALERARALLAGFPLDIYVFELREIPRKIRPDEPAIVLMDPEGIFRQRPGGTLSFQAFCNRFREKFLPP